jgi:hypothetical protein
MFLQIATEFATIGVMLSPSQPIRLPAEDKLAALRRLDKSRAWNSLDALYILNALLPVAFPLRLTGSCLLNRTLSVKSTVVFVTTVAELSGLGFVGL